MSIEKSLDNTLLNMDMEGGKYILKTLIMAIRMRRGREEGEENSLQSLYMSIRKRIDREEEEMSSLRTLTIHIWKKLKVTMELEVHHLRIVKGDKHSKEGRGYPWAEIAGLKLKIPPFHDKDPNAYLEWEKKIDIL